MPSAALGFLFGLKVSCSKSRPSGQRTRDKGQRTADSGRAGNKEMFSVVFAALAATFISQLLQCPLGRWSAFWGAEWVAEWVVGWCMRLWECLVGQFSKAVSSGCRREPCSWQQSLQFAAVFGTCIRHAVSAIWYMVSGCRKSSFSKLSRKYDERKQ